MKHEELATKFRLAMTPEGVGLVFTNEEYEAAAVALLAAQALADEHAEDIAMGNGQERS